MLQSKFTKKTVIPMVIAALIGFGGATVASYANATHAATTTDTTTASNGKLRGGMNRGQGVMGTITVINGSMITVIKDAKPDTTTTGTAVAAPVTYTIDATNAKIMKMTGDGTPSAITVAGLAVGDKVMAKGTLSGTTLTATEVVTGTFPTPVKPAAVGKVTAVSGNAITLIQTDNNTTTTYTVDATNAKIMKVTPPAAGTTSTTTTKPVRPTPTTITVSDIVVGDTLMVQGTTSGTNITATSIVDGMMFGGGHRFSGSRGTHTQQSTTATQ